MNPELILNPYITPIYVTATNTVIPLATISFNSIYNDVAEFMTYTFEVLSVITATFMFIAKEALIAINNNLSIVEKFLLGLCVFNFITLILIENTYSESKQHKETREILEAHEINLHQIRKQERMREDWEQLWAEEIKIYHKEMTKKMEEYQRNMEEYERKFKTMENKIKKMKKDMDEYN